jgi:UPF0042 nucleotide-binding protein
MTEHSADRPEGTPPEDITAEGTSRGGRQDNGRGAAQETPVPRAPGRGTPHDDGAQVSTGSDTAGTPGAPETAIPELVIISGMSGAGRSTAAKCLEDLGWFVVDNLPPALIPTMVELGARSQGNVARIAVVVDVRGRRFFDNLRESLADLEARHVTRRIVFLESSDEALVRRFESVRRPHPLQGDGRIVDGIAAERELLHELRDSADIVLDTSEFNVHALATAITELFSDTGPVALRLNVMSFGFKYGLPVDANFVVDARFIPNPHWIPQLRPHTGLDKDVSEYVLEAEGVKSFVDRYVLAIEPVLDGYRRENKHYATIAVGCTGGKHRSVAVAVELSKKLAQYPRVTVTTAHRDLGRE